MSYYEYDPADGDDDDLQRLLEGRDVENDAVLAEIQENPRDHGSEERREPQKPVKSKTPKPEIKRRNVEALRDEYEDDFIVREENDDDMADFIENDMDDYEDGAPNPAEEAIEVPAPSEARVIKAKRIVKNPRLKLDSKMLKTSKGLIVLQEAQKNLKLKGKGHEKEDLDKIMFTIEHWAHRLFPQYTFDDFLEKTEKLGTTREISTYLNQARNGIPLEISDRTMGPDIIEDDGEEDTEDLFGPQRDQANAEDAFDALMEHESTEVAATNPTESLSEEQLKQIADKRLKAIERRQRAEETSSSTSAVNNRESNWDKDSSDNEENSDKDLNQLGEDDILAQLNIDSDDDETGGQASLVIDELTDFNYDSDASTVCGDTVRRKQIRITDDEDSD
ncbi:TIMELESS-interacting protein [Halotydeus destructor]|nr:TIMELESS-interacting protein [Halotydeus destructor]